MTRLGVLLIISLMALAAAPQADSGPLSLGPEWWQDPALSAELNLSEEQKVKLAGLHQALLAELTPLRDRLLNARMEIRALWSHTQPDRSRIAARQQEILALRSRMQEVVTRFQQESQACLTPEQRQKLAAALAGRGCRWCGPGRWARGR